MNKIIQFFGFLLIASAPLYSSVEPDEKIVLIHGFFGASWNLKYHEYMLKKHGLDTILWDYSSREKTIQMHAEDLVTFLQNEAVNHPGQPIHFVTHSMGGLVLRAAINHPKCPLEAKSGRAVLLSPPNQGAMWGRTIGEWKVVSALCQDKSGRELLTQSNFDYLGEFPLSMQIKVIAGDHSFNPFISVPNDGTVTVEETILNTPHEHETIHQEHHSILLSKKANRLIYEFFIRPN